ncbi:hypothetical protein CB0940_10091 [Cercospora beticola]|uniref:Uncharacterized protein n=1 Tax=Cercospora beticola TaxID=122368 RepID=A0A2G5HV28_CERBT|nr:hypothetical protein CB0940_10091 [Cercospora beticola]PIA96143.1 hypothetical protein CB0940_10091 [Cercospora beticola]WPB06794.1 hypothetical protein RHO25_011454 [Cercospora beticola]CAK1366704.1 unnamed protein product [Cercospora beticola]
MAPLVTGLHLSEIQWNKFKASYMWGKTYYLRRTKFVLYQTSTLLLAAVSGISNAAANKYIDRRDDVIEQDPTLDVDVGQIIAVRVMLTVLGGILGFLFGMALLFDLWWPERRESKVMSLGWKCSSLAGSLAQFAAALAASIIVATGEVEIKGPDQQAVDEQLAAWPNSEYRESGTAIVTVVLAWIGFAFIASSTGVMWKSYAVSSKHGPFANYRRQEIL